MLYYVNPSRRHRRRNPSHATSSLGARMAQRKAARAPARKETPSRRPWAGAMHGGDVGHAAWKNRMQRRIAARRKRHSMSATPNPRRKRRGPLAGAALAAHMKKIGRRTRAAKAGARRVGRRARRHGAFMRQTLAFKQRRAKRAGVPKRRRKKSAARVVRARKIRRSTQAGRKSMAKRRRRRRRPHARRVSTIRRRKRRAHAVAPKRRRKRRRKAAAVAAPKRRRRRRRAASAAPKRRRRRVAAAAPKRRRRKARRAAPRRRRHGRRRHTGIRSLARARRSIRYNKRRRGGSAARKYMARYRMRSNPDFRAMGRGLMGAVKSALPVAGSLYLSRFLIGQFGGLVPFVGNLGSFARPALSGVWLAIAHFVGKKFLPKYHGAIMMGAGLNLVDSLVSAFAPASVKGMFGLSDYISIGGMGEYVQLPGMSDYIEVGAEEDLGALEQELGLEQEMGDDNSPAVAAASGGLTNPLMGGITQGTLVSPIPSQSMVAAVPARSFTKQIPGVTQGFDKGDHLYTGIFGGGFGC